MRRCDHARHVPDRSTYELSCETKVQALSAKEFQIAELLMERPGMIVTTEQLLSQVWGWDADVDTSMVWVHISNLRKKLASLGSTTSIHVNRGLGYILETEQ